VQTQSFFSTGARQFGEIKRGAIKKGLANESHLSRSGLECSDIETWGKWQIARRLGGYEGLAIRPSRPVEAPTLSGRGELIAR
jgi:hypothetical protein